jgi:hypothetical protein
MKNIKSKTRTKITNTHLENSLQIATSKIKADTDRLMENIAKFLTKAGHFYACKISKICQLIVFKLTFLDSEYVIFINWT